MFGLLIASLSVMSQEVFYYGFEYPSHALPVGNLEYRGFLPSDTRDSINSMSHTGNYSLMLNNALLTATASQRAMKFRNIPIQPNTSYRVSYWVKADPSFTINGTTSNTTIVSALCVGDDNGEVNFVGKNNKTYEAWNSGFTQDNWKKVTQMCYYGNDDVQKAYYKSVNPKATSDVALKYFLKVAAYTPGVFYLDDISIKKSSIRGITYHGDVIKVDFGYDYNGAALREGKDYSTASLPSNCVYVTNDGVALDVEAVEVQANGFFIFLKTDYLDDSAEGKIKVSFTNPKNDLLALKYTGDLRPDAFNASSDKRVLDFEEEVAEYDINLTGSSIIYNPPFLKSADPENESFDLPTDKTSYKFTYSKKIDCTQAKANMAGPAGKFALELQEKGFQNTLTFNVPAGKNLFTGDYMITVSNITSEQGIPADLDDQITFSMGESASGSIDTVYNSNKVWAAAAYADNVIPAGWVRLQASKTPANNDLKVGFYNNPGASRLRTFVKGGDMDYGFYHCARDKDTIRTYYGALDGYKLNLKAGKYTISFNSAYWNGVTTGAFNFRVKNSKEEIVFEKASYPSSFDCKNTNVNVKILGSAVTTCTFFLETTDNYILEWESHAGWASTVFGNIKMISVPSVAAQYKGKLAAAIGVAQGTYTASDSSIYQGMIRDNLKWAIENYSTFKSTAPSAYVKAAAEVLAYNDALISHVKNVDAYTSNLATANTKISTYATQKFAKLPSYPKLIDAATKYANVDFKDDPAVKTAGDTLLFYNTLFQNWVNNGVPALTYRLNKAINSALKVGVDSLSLDYARNELYDNDEMVNNLNTQIKQYLYNKIALNEIKFGNSIDDSTATDSLELTSYIKNPNFYNKTPGKNLNNNSFAGWTTNEELFNTGPNDTITAVNPVLDTYAVVFNVPVGKFEQTVTNVPVGVYNVHMKCRMGNPVNNGLTLAEVAGIYYFYVIVGSDTTKIDFRVDNFGLPATPTVIKNVPITNGTFTLGVHTGMYPGFTPTLFWGDPALWMVNKAEGFNYTGLKNGNVEKGKVIDVQYFTIQGTRTNNLIRGMNIVKTIYDNGTVDVKKIMLK